MEYTLKDFGKHLKRQHLENRRFFDAIDSDCYRIYDRNLGPLPVTVDLYGDYVRITDYGVEEVAEKQICDIVSRMVYVPLDRIVYHARPRLQAHEQHQVIDTENPRYIKVREQGLEFLVDLWSRIDTGLFLDHAPARAMVRAASYGKEVLNLFSYTGSFAVYALGGGAQRVTNVDLSGTYLDWGVMNLTANHFSTASHENIRADVWAFIEEQRAKGFKRQFDIIVLDPPTFSHSRKMQKTFDVQRDHVSYLAACRRMLKKDGVIVFSTNLGGFRLDAKRLSSIGLSFRDITKDTIPPGYSMKRIPHSCWKLEHA